MLLGFSAPTVAQVDIDAFQESRESLSQLIEDITSLAQTRNDRGDTAEGSAALAALNAINSVAMDLKYILILLAFERNVNDDFQTQASQIIDIAIEDAIRMADVQVTTVNLVIESLDDQALLLEARDARQQLRQVVEILSARVQ